jgi:hypothetical protein
MSQGNGQNPTERKFNSIFGKGMGAGVRIETLGIKEHRDIHNQQEFISAKFNDNSVNESIELERFNPKKHNKRNRHLLPHDFEYDPEIHVVFKPSLMKSPGRT